MEKESESPQVIKSQLQTTNQSSAIISGSRSNLAINQKQSNELLVSPKRVVVPTTVTLKLETPRAQNPNSNNSRLPQNTAAISITTLTTQHVASISPNHTYTKSSNTLTSSTPSSLQPRVAIPQAPLQSQNTPSKRAEVTLVRLAPKSASSSQPGAAFAILTLPLQGSGAGSTQSKVAIVKLSPKGTNTAGPGADSLPKSLTTHTPTRTGATLLAPRDYTPLRSAVLTNLQPPPPYSEVVKRPSNATENLPSVSFQLQIVRPKKPRFLIGAWIYLDQ